MIFAPRDYQEPAIEHVVDVRSAALWMSMGLGKTPCVLTALTWLHAMNLVRRTLVVAPLRVATMVWAQEAAKWDHTNHLRVQLIRGTAAERMQQIRTPADVHVINYDLLKWLVQSLDGKWPWDYVVSDESSRLANQETWRWRALKHVRPRIKRITELTGTPAPRGLDSVWAQVYLLDKGRRLHKTRGMFRRQWLEPVDRDERQWVAKDGAIDAVSERLRDIVLSLRASDHLDLPPQVEHDLEVELSDKLMVDYRRLEREMFLRLEEGEINSPTAAATSTKCAQYANGAVYLDEDEGMPATQKRYAITHDEKLQALDSVVEEAAGESVLVAYTFRHDRERILKEFPQAEVLGSDPKQLDRWNRGEIPMLLAHPRSAGHGLNLQGGGRIICFYGLTWSLEDYEQIIERIGPTRQLQAGTPRTVFVYRIVCRGTVDELIRERLVTRASIQDVLRKAMRRRAA